jgi:hypothetical protein
MSLPPHYLIRPHDRHQSVAHLLGLHGGLHPSHKIYRQPMPNNLGLGDILHGTDDILFLVEDRYPSLVSPTPRVALTKYLSSQL